jgi:hypothetical protein
MIKSGKAKEIKGNYLNSKIVGLSLDPLTQSINKNGKVITNKMYINYDLDGKMLLKLYQ